MQDYEQDQLAATLSAAGEKQPRWAWNLNMTGLLTYSSSRVPRAGEGILAELDCCFRPHDAATWYAAADGHGARHRLWNLQARR